MTHRRCLLALAQAGAVALFGCATIPAGRYGISSVEIHGAEKMDDKALSACLATYERPRFSFDLGTNPSPECDVPPFDSDRATLNFWRWPWTEWPLFDRTVFERDLDRVLRWYQARGFYDARILDYRVEPKAALLRDRPVASATDTEDSEEGEPIDIDILVNEGEPIVIERVKLLGDSQLPMTLRKALHLSIGQMLGERFDETEYDLKKAALAQILNNASYAHAKVEGQVSVDTKRHKAAVRIALMPGSPCFFGKVRLHVDKRFDLPRDTILGAAKITSGAPYSVDVLEDARREIYALGAFSSVQINPKIKESDARIDIDIRLEPGRLFRYGLGAGVLLGVAAYNAIQEQQDVQQWDVHLLGFVEFRNFFGGLRRLRIEERPRLIFTQAFPRAQPDDPQLGNLVIVDFRQPGFAEPRTTLASGVRWDYGPQPYGEPYFRHDIDAWAGPQRHFFGGHVFLSLRLHTNIFSPTKIEEVRDPPTDYQVLFFEQYARLDLRNRPRQPRYGAFFALGLHEAVPPGSWNYVRITPDARGYIPLPLGMVLATRFAVGMMQILSTKISARDNPTLANLGPDSYRLRGGGPNSVRGFLAGRLGDGLEGGIRRWEASAELRVPLTPDFETVAFVDAGDVSQGDFRFDHPQTSVGLGVRYHTIIGPIRFDVGWRVPKWQVVGEDQRDPNREGRPTDVDFGFVKFPGAVHITIGEPF
ncbi:MAG: BamA/TamA family outer membrane protein [Myxococcales bacterium]|nr:BamA/TamA family outer membrane protein [Myxococcales bacterium]MCB9708160.1 BamA/TamA family outer membrane protein [Myxococcales bacterium]